jgi:XTP/dITP diphosphohydrolase
LDSLNRILVVATRNPDKLREIAHFFRDLPVDLRSLAEFSHVRPVVEDGATIFDNALKKALQVAQDVGQWVLADDTALEVDALGGAPGVLSARYSGPKATYESNRRKLLSQLQRTPINQRQALFRTVVALRLEKEVHLFEGTLSGRIVFEPRGDQGFGYDPVFELSDGRTLAEIELPEKNRISHRAQALQRTRVFLERLLAGHLLG